MESGDRPGMELNGRPEHAPKPCPSPALGILDAGVRYPRLLLPLPLPCQAFLNSPAPSCPPCPILPSLPSPSLPSRLALPSPSPVYRTHGTHTWSPCPSCPYLLQPKVNTRPSSVTTALCRQPHTTLVTVTPSRPTTRVGVYLPGGVGGEGDEACRGRVEATQRCKSCNPDGLKPRGQAASPDERPIRVRYGNSAEVALNNYTFAEVESAAQGAAMRTPSNTPKAGAFPCPSLAPPVLRVAVPEVAVPAPSPREHLHGHGWELDAYAFEGGLQYAGQAQSSGTIAHDRTSCPFRMPTNSAQTLHNRHLPGFGDPSPVVQTHSGIQTHAHARTHARTYASCTAFPIICATPRPPPSPCPPPWPPASAPSRTPHSTPAHPATAAAAAVAAAVRSV